MEANQRELHEAVSKCLVEALLQLCGGTLARQDDIWKACHKSISFPNKKSTSPAGKPHDVEVRVALNLFHRWKRSSGSGIIEILSDLGLSRHIDSPRNLAELIVLPLEEICRREGIAHDVRNQPSGLISIVTVERSRILRAGGKLPCPKCIKWCSGEKGLWWHQQQHHQVDHAVAASSAASTTDTMALVLYQSGVDSFTPLHTPPRKIPATSDNEPIEYVKNGDLEGLTRAVQTGYMPKSDLDRRGASPLMWAAGSGHLDIVKYLVEDCGCDPGQPQQGKRSFKGRTPLHWAARNGRLEVVHYLVNECRVDLESATADGTTAFCWASWQGHLPIMVFLMEKGCNIHSQNSFGCNAVLWCAQGHGDIDCMEWLESQRCDMQKVNNNGHGVLHKAAQRGQDSVSTWFLKRFVETYSNVRGVLTLVGPDSEGHCPSDLAGMEGYEDLAQKLALAEMDLLRRISARSRSDLPQWLYKVEEGVSMRIAGKELFIWESLGGIRRMRFRIEHEGQYSDFLATHCTASSPRVKTKTLPL